MFSLKQGSVLVKLARKSISHFALTKTILSEKPSEPVFKKKFGVFVSLHSFPSQELRGCIGFPMPVMPLWSAVIKAAVLAAFEDFRFSPLTLSELNSIIVEISILSEVRKFDCEKKDLPKAILIGTHGLLIRKGFNSGLLLPQVALHQGWSVLEFLEHCCLKAGLSKDCWRENGCIVEYFTAQIFKEQTPNGEVVKED